MTPIHSPNCTDPDMGYVRRYNTDPAFRQREDRKVMLTMLEEQRARDAAMIAKGYRWPCNWTPEEQADASAKLMAAHEARIGLEGDK